MPWDTNEEAAAQASYENTTFSPDLLPETGDDDGWFTGLFSPVTDYVSETYEGVTDYVGETYEGITDYVEGTYDDATESVGGMFDVGVEDLLPEALADGLASFMSVATTVITGIPIAFLAYFGIKIAISQAGKRRSRNIMYSVPKQSIDQFTGMISQAGGNIAGISRDSGYVYVNASSRGQADQVVSQLKSSGVNVIRLGK